jgi:HD-GYP domain-containing protein (c-di-GMP phosphodiesterase class II)
MKTHAELGGDMLSGAKINEAAMLVALQHHERFDGTGYYRGLAKNDIHIFARIAAVADVYDAMTSKRVYQAGMVPEDALKRLYLMRGTHFQPEIVERLIICLGIYPIGTFIELNTGELAVVKMVNRSHPMQPRIQLLSDREKRHCKTPQEVDLKDEIGRWIVATRKPEEFAPIAEPLAC